jgi:hypothetical protein
VDIQVYRRVLAQIIIITYLLFTFFKDVLRSISNNIYNAAVSLHVYRHCGSLVDFLVELKRYEMNAQRIKDR